MENVTEALKMAGSVLIFVVALSICVMSFSQARQAIDSLVAFSDREYLTIENDDNFFYRSASGTSERYVNKETVIPSIYRAYKENYKIVFNFNDSYYLFEQDLNNDLSITDDEKIKIIDLEKQVIGSDKESRQFIDGILYRGYSEDYGNDGNAGIWNNFGSPTTRQKYESKFHIRLNNTQSLYQYLEAHERIKEQLGTYYQEDLTGIDKEDKTEKRVITYTFE